MKKIARRLFKKKEEVSYTATKNTHVKVLFSSENPSLLGKTMKTTAIELAPKSIRLELDHAAEIDSVLDIAVKLHDSGRTYNLTGNVKWRIPAAKGQHQIVLALRERTDILSDLKAWKANFERILDQAKVV
jgi:hypothetical protein